MTSYPACNISSLSRKACITHKKLFWLSISHGRSFRIRHGKSPEASPGGKTTLTSYPTCNKTTLSRKPHIADKKFNMDHHEEVMVALSESVMKNCVKRLLMDKSR